MNLPTATEILRAWDAARPRNSQAELGVSELGGCRRAAGYRLHGYPQEDNGGSSMQAILGSAIHEVFAKAAAQQIGGDPGVVIFDDTSVRFAGVLGHPDVYANEQVVDLKTTGYAIQIAKIRRDGPPRKHLWQIATYAAALILEGKPVRTVRLNYIDRGTGEEYVWESPFRMQDVRDAMAWLENVKNAPLESLPRDYDADSVWCASCPFFGPCWGRAVPDRDPRSVLYIEDPDTEGWLKKLADARERKAEAEADEKLARGALDALRTVAKPGESQDIQAGSMQARITVTKGRTSLDREQIELDYARAEAKVPLRRGDPSVTITILTRKGPE